MPQLKEDSSSQRPLSGAHRKVAGRSLLFDVIRLYSSREPLILPVPLSRRLPKPPHTAVHNAASTHVPVASMAGPAPSLPSKDMAAPCVTSAYLARPPSCTSTSPIMGARDQDGGRTFGGSKISIRKMGKSFSLFGNEPRPFRFDPKKYVGLHINIHKHSKLRQAIFCPSLIIKRFHVSGGKQCPLMTWPPD